MENLRESPHSKKLDKSSRGFGVGAQDIHGMMILHRWDERAGRREGAKGNITAFNYLWGDTKKTAADSYQCCTIKSQETKVPGFSNWNSNLMLGIPYSPPAVFTNRDRGAVRWWNLGPLWFFQSHLNYFPGNLIYFWGFSCSEQEFVEQTSGGPLQNKTKQNTCLILCF